MRTLIRRLLQVEDPIVPDVHRMLRTLLLLASIVAGQVPLAAAQDDGWVNVRTFGAVPDDKTDSTAAIQAAIDAVAARPARGKVLLPSGSGCYRITSPLRLRVPGLRIEGDNFALYGAGTCITAADFAGPIFHATIPPTEDMPFGQSLVPGDGRSLVLSTKTQDSASYLDLQYAAAARLDGLTAFTAELFFRIDAAGSNYPTLWASSGSLGGSDPTHSAFAFDLDPESRLTARLNVGGRVHSIASTPLTRGRVYHAALSYDGASMRFFIGVPGEASTLVGSTGATGPIVQGPYELMPLGGRRGPWPHGARFTDVVDGAIDSLRLSKTARYAGVFTAPDRKLAFDERTLLLENFERETPEFSIVRTSYGTTYLPKHPPITGLLGYLEIAHLQLNAGAGCGIWLHGVFMSNFHHLGILGGVFGVSGREANFLNSFSNVHLASGDQPFAKAGIALTTNVEITSVRDASFSGWPTAIAFTDSGGGIVSSVFVHGHQQVFPFVFTDSWVHLDSVHSSNEDADPGFVANVRLTGHSNLSITGGRIERYVDSGPALEIDGQVVVTVSATRFQMGKDAAEVIRVRSGPRRPVLILNGETIPENVPWSTTAGAVRTLP